MSIFYIKSGRFQIILFSMFRPIKRKVSLEQIVILSLNQAQDALSVFMEVTTPFSTLTYRDIFHDEDLYEGEVKLIQDLQQFGKELTRQEPLNYCFVQPVQGSIVMRKQDFMKKIYLHKASSDINQYYSSSNSSRQLQEEEENILDNIQVEQRQEYSHEPSQNQSRQSDMNNLEEQIKTYLEDFTGFNIQQEHPQPPSNKSTERDLLQALQINCFQSFWRRMIMWEKSFAGFVKQGTNQIQWNGGTFRGQLEDGVPHGRGIYFYGNRLEDNIFFVQSSWNTGVMYGETIIHYNNGNYEYCEMMEGVKQGKSIKYFNVGCRQECEFRDGLLHGLYRKYGMNDSVMYEALYENGRLKRRTI